MADYYLWTRMSVPSSEEPHNPQKAKQLNPGDKVTASDLGVSDEQFADYVESGAVRTQKFPELPEGYQGSVTDWYREQALAVARGEVEAPKAKDETPPPVEGGSKK